MSGSQHNPNGRQSQLGSGWSPLQVLQMANLLARAPQAHMASDRGVTWHTPTPPPHLYHVPAPSPPDPLQAMKNAGSNSVFRHTATPPELYRHTPTPPDKHLMRHTPSPGDVKSGPPMPPGDLYPHLGPGRDKLVREELLAYARGVDLSLGSRANGAPPHPPHAAHPAHAPHPAHPAHSPALSVRDAPTINSLISRGGARRVDSLLERLGAGGAGGAPPHPAPSSPHSVIVHGRAAPTPSPPSSNEDSADSFGAAPGSKRKRKPERTVRVPAPPLLAPAPLALPPAPAPRAPSQAHWGANPHPSDWHPNVPTTEPSSLQRIATSEDGKSAEESRLLEIFTSTTGCASASPAAGAARASPPAENGHAAASPPHPAPPPAPAPDPPAHTDPASDEGRRKTRSGSAETIAEIAAMIAGGAGGAGAAEPPAPAPAPLSVDKLKSVLASPEPEERVDAAPDRTTSPGARRVRAGGAPARGAGAAGGAGSPSEARAADGAAAAEPAAAFVEVENQLEKMFAGLEEDRPKPASDREDASAKESLPPSKRRKCPAGRGREAPPRRKGPRKKPEGKPRGREREGYDSGSNASSSRSRGPYIQIRGPRASPVSVCVMNAATGEEEESGARARRGAERRRGLHASTLGLRYDAATRDLTWLCAFCGRAPHARALGDLFGPYALDTDLPEYRALDEPARRRFAAEGARHEAWLHADCAVWAPGVVAAGARVWGLARAVWAAAAERCRACARAGAPLACAARTCPARAHLPCARAAGWRLDETDFRALCPAHRPPPIAPHL